MGNCNSHQHIMQHVTCIALDGVTLIKIEKNVKLLLITTHNTLGHYVFRVLAVYEQYKIQLSFHQCNKFSQNLH